MLKELAVAKAKADKDYKQAFELYFGGDAVALLPDERFFEIVKLYVREVYTFSFGLGRTNGIKEAAWELFRKALCKEKGYSGDELVQFAKTYAEMEHRLYKPLFDLIKNKGDDGYGDLLDNLPLLGAKLFKSLETREFGNPEVVQEKIAKASGKALGISDGQAFRFIWHGENYHTMMLREAAEKYTFLKHSRED